MTRYSLRPLPELTHIYEVAIGWDPNLATFFVAIFGPPDEDHDPVLLRWIGATYGEIEEPQPAITFARRVAEVPCFLHRRLRLDRQRFPPACDPGSPVEKFLTNPVLIGSEP